jgi:hypothetical protein
LFGAGELGDGGEGTIYCVQGEGFLLVLLALQTSTLMLYALVSRWLRPFVNRKSAAALAILTIILTAGGVGWWLIC